MWKLKAEAAHWEPLPGVPWRDLTDSEFQEVSESYDKQFLDQPGSLLRWFKHIKDTPAPAVVGMGTNEGGT